MNDNSKLLYAATYALCHEACGHVSGTKVNEVILVVSRFAIYSATAGVLGAIPAIGSITAALAQTALVWTMYVQINKIIGLEFEDSKMKFIGSAILSNLSVNVGSIILAIAGAAVVSFIPYAGNVASAAICGSIGYVMMYSAALLYILYLNKIFKVKGKIEITGDKQDEEFIDEVMKENDLKAIVEEAKKNYKQDKQDGALDKAKSEKKCPICGDSYTDDQPYCTNCGFKLK